MKILLMIVAILFGGTAVYAGNLNKIHGESWSCKRLDSRFPDEFINKCYECEEKGQDFFQDNKPKSPDDFESGVGHCVPKGQVAAGKPSAKDKSQDNRAPSREQTRTPAPKKNAPAATPKQWFSIAVALWKDSAGVHVRSGYATRMNRAEAESAALKQCGNSRCVTKTSWNNGCGWVSIGKGQDSTGVTAGYGLRKDRAASVQVCEGMNMSCEAPIGGCAN